MFFLRRALIFPLYAMRLFRIAIKVPGYYRQCGKTSFMMSAVNQMTRAPVGQTATRERKARQTQGHAAPEKIFKPCLQRVEKKFSSHLRNQGSVPPCSSVNNTYRFGSAAARWHIENKNMRKKSHAMFLRDVPCVRCDARRGNIKNGK